MQHNILCDHPKVILNPKVIDFIAKYKVYYINGVRRTYHGSRRVNLDRLKFILSPRKNGITPDSDLSVSYAIDLCSGTIVDVYILVPCGHCANCEMSRRWTHVFKCQLESQCFRSNAWFVTLTYRNSELPKVSFEETFRPLDGNGCCMFDEHPFTSIKTFPTLSVRDVQLFLKRFRINLSRMFDGKYNFPLRYCACGEYGKKGRPHYHLIIWGIDTFSPVDYSAVLSILEHSWSKGWITCRLVHGDDDKCFRYTTKYLVKDRSSSHMVDFRQRRPFLNSSKGKLGGLGKRFLLSTADHVRNFFDTQLKYFNRFSGKAENIQFNSWSLNILFPSFCRLVPADVRRAVLENSFYEYLKGLSRTQLTDVFSRYMFIPDWDDGVSITPKYTEAECLTIISKWQNKLGLSWYDDIDVYLSDCRNKDYYRQKFMFYLGSQFNRNPIDVRYRSRRAIDERNRMLSLEQLD